MKPGVAPSAGERSHVDLTELRNEFKKASGNEQIASRGQASASPKTSEGLIQCQ